MDFTEFTAGFVVLTAPMLGLSCLLVEAAEGLLSKLTLLLTTPSPGVGLGVGRVQPSGLFDKCSPFPVQDGPAHEEPGGARRGVGGAFGPRDPADQRRGGGGVGQLAGGVVASRVGHGAAPRRIRRQLDEALGQGRRVADGIGRGGPGVARRAGDLGGVRADEGEPQGEPFGHPRTGSETPFVERFLGDQGKVGAVLVTA